MSKTLYRGKIVTLKRLDDRWEVVEHAPAVAVLVVRDGRVLGVRQRRPAIGRDTWELPAGLVDPGERPEQAAARELAEETGLAGTLELVTRFFASPGFTDEEIFLFEAADVEHVEALPDPGEDLTIDWRDPADVWRDASSGALATSGVTLLGIQRVLARRSTS